jgi:hypothetical protein
MKINKRILCHASLLLRNDLELICDCIMYVDECAIWIDCIPINIEEKYGSIFKIKSLADIYYKKEKFYCDNFGGDFDLGFYYKKFI